jgi:hypothetical protein
MFATRHSIVNGRDPLEAAGPCHAATGSPLAGPLDEASKSWGSGCPVGWWATSPNPVPRISASSRTSPPTALPGLRQVLRERPRFLARAQPRSRTADHTTSPYASAIRLRHTARPLADDQEVACAAPRVHEPVPSSGPWSCEGKVRSSRSAAELNGQGAATVDRIVDSPAQANVAEGRKPSVHEDAEGPKVDGVRTWALRPATMRDS